MEAIRILIGDSSKPFFELVLSPDAIFLAVGSYIFVQLIESIIACRKH